MTQHVKRSSVREMMENSLSLSHSESGEGGSDPLAQTFPRRSIPKKQFSLNKLVENRMFYKAVGKMRRRHHVNATIAGTKSVLTFVRWREHVRSKKPKTPPGVKFRRYIKLALICVKLCKNSYESLEAARGEFLSASQYSEEFKTTIDKDGLVFDPSEFKANKEGRVSSETKRILQTKFDERSQKDIDHLMVALKGIKSFKEYPRYIQDKLCQIGWYESFGPKRAIIRQGHPPRTFYFILSGTVVVSKFDRKTHDFQILVFLQQGMSFGELAVIKRGVRQATVSTKTTVELLCISVEDYRNIFMAGSFKDLKDSELNTFIRNISFLKKFPIDVLADEKNQNDFLFHYYHRGQILARDSNCSDWIFIVKSGSVSVLKKLEEVRPNFNLSNDNTEEVIEVCKSANHPGKDTRLHLPHLNVRSRRKPPRETRLSFLETILNDDDKEGETFKDQADMEKRLVESLPGYRTEAERLGVLDYADIIQKHNDRVLSVRLPGSPEPDGTNLPVISTTLPPTDEQDEGVQEDNSSPVRKTSKGAYLSVAPSRRKVSRAEMKENDMADLKKKLEGEKRALERSLANRKTMADELDSSPQRYKEQTAADLHPMFTEVQVLERGQHFGVSNLVFGEQPSLSLVSNGAECIMISKRLFLQHALAATMDLLRQQEYPFPPQEEMQNNLQDFVNWQEHRQRVYRRLVLDKEAKFQLKKSFIQQYTGQYSYRTGPI